MVPLKYAEECAKAYRPGKEDEYVRCILAKADDYAARYPRGKDKHVVRRATKALVHLHLQHPSGVEGRRILYEAGFEAYDGPNDGLWPWLKKNGGIGVVEKKPGRKYTIVAEFYPALRRAF